MLGSFPKERPGGFRKEQDGAEVLDAEYLEDNLEWLDPSKQAVGVAQLKKSFNYVR